jgi:hypothetical protein
MPRQPNIRNKGYKGPDLDRYKYNWLLQQGFSSSQAQEYRRKGWPKIDEAVKMLKQGLTLSEKDYYKRKTETKRAPKKEKKQRAKKKLNQLEGRPEAPPGYHYAYYKKTGKYVLRKNPTRENKPKQNIIHMVFIKDQTDDVNASDYINMQHDHLRKNNDELKHLIKEWLHKSPQQEGSIGRVRSYLVTSEREYESFLQQHSSFALILGERPGYHEILATLATIAQGVYENWRKQEYATEILYQVEEYSKHIYKKLVADDLI